MAIRTSTLGMVAVGGGAFILADTLPISPPQRAAVKFGGLALGVLGVFRLLEDLKSSGGLIGTIGGALVPVGPAEERVTNESTIPTSPTGIGLPSTEEARRASDALEVAARAETTEGLALGALSAPLTGFIVRPAEDAEVSRSLFSSTVELELEIQNNTSSPARALVEVSAFLERLFGNSRTRSTVGTFDLAGGERKRITFTWDTGDRNTGLFETGAANVALELIVNGRAVASTLFQVT